MKLTLICEILHSVYSQYFVYTKGYALSDFEDWLYTVQNLTSLSEDERKLVVMLHSALLIDQKLL